VPWERESLADSVEGMRGNTRGVRAGRVCGVCASRMNRSLKGGIIITAAMVYKLVVLYNARNASFCPFSTVVLRRI
jgi:hypothetical protein